MVMTVNDCEIILGASLFKTTQDDLDELKKEGNTIPYGKYQYYKSRIAPNVKKLYDETWPEIGKYWAGPFFYGYAALMEEFIEVFSGKVSAEFVGKKK